MTAIRRPRRFTIDIIDDVPTARHDTDFVPAEEFGPVTGNVITDDDPGDEGDSDNGADTVGADDAHITAVTGDGDTETTEGGWIVQGQYGVLTINDDGSYSYLRDEGTPGGVSDVFTYTLTDGDGDTSNTTLTITIEDATPRLATPAIAQLDDETFAGGNPGGTDDANPNTANLSGNLAGEGGDGDLDYAFTGTNTLPAGFSVDPSSTATELKIAQAGVGIVLTITLDVETGAYTVTQNLPMDHPTPGLSEEDLTFGIGVKTVDADGDSAVSTLTINADDDTPTAANDTDTVAAGTATGNVITDAAAGDAGDSDSGADSPGADGIDTITQLSGFGGTDSDATGGFTVNGQYGSLVMDAAGNYTYTRNDGLGGGQNEVFTYIYRDGDGDLASATLTITIPDATPSLGTPAIAQTDDEIFAGGNAGGTGDANPNQANMSGNLAGSGGDGDLDYAFTGVNTLPAGFSLDASSTASSLKITQAGVGIVMTIDLDLETGAYTITHNQPIDHPTPGTTEEDVQFLIGVKVTDIDGDSAVNTLTINADDDTPTAANDTDTVAAGTATGNVITDAAAGDAGDSDTGADSPGADGFGAITQLSGFGGTDSDATGGFTVNGQYGSLQMDASGNYTYTRNDGLGGGQNEVFTYIYRDGDGDLASATLTITIPDVVPTLGTPAIAQTDDEIFAGGNAGGTGDANPNQANMSGNLAGSGGDGDLDYAFTGVNTLPAGFSLDASSTASSLKITQAGVGIVMTIDLDLETGAYTITHNQPIDHPTPGTTEEDVQFLIGVKVTDIDGDSAVNTLTINADDDTPTAANDTDTVAAGTATGNVITDAAAGDAGDSDTGADSPGADGFGAITQLSGFGGTDSDATGGFTVNGQYGSLQMDASGNYTYTRNDGLGGGQNEVFTYIYRDGDGDLASATLTITIPDVVPTLGTPAIAQTDDEIFAGGNAGGTGDANPNQANMSGNLAGSGGDGDLDYAFTGVNTLPAGFSLDASSTASSLKITQAGVGIVMTIDLDLETGAYTITHNQPIDHPTPGTTEEDVQFLIGVKVTDIDGDSAVNTLTINADDDTPTAANDTDTVAAGTATGNVITDAAAGDAGDSDTGADSPGADGFGAITQLSGFGGTDSDATGGFTVNGQYGSLQMDASGNYTYTRNDGLGGGQNEVFTYIYRDGDGDLASATLTITIPDVVPTLGTPAIAQTDDEIFAGGNAGGTGDANPNQANMSGNLAGSGGDGDLDYAFTGTNTLPAGFSLDASSTASSLKITQAGVGIVMTIDLDLETGAYTITHNQPIDHPTPGTTEEDVQFLIGVKVTDIDGDSAVNTLTINADDDTPIFGPANTTTLNVDNNANPYNEGVWVMSVGADKNADNNDVALSNFTVSVNGEELPLTDYEITGETETATSVIYTFDFTYDTGSGGPTTTSGTMEFFKSGPNAGTYAVALDDPIVGFSTLETADGTAFVGYVLNTDPNVADVPDGTNPTVAVTTIVEETGAGDDGFYVQFTGIAAGNTGHETINYDPVDPSTGDGSNATWVPGELFSEGNGADALWNSYVTVSNDSNGVAGDTVNGPDAINFDLHSSNPGGTVGGLPTASSSSMFMVFDGIGEAEDMIVVLKLWQDTDGIEGISAGDDFTTKAILVQNGDIYKFGAAEEAGTVAALAGTPYESVVADIVALGGSNNNDGLVIIESNDYNIGGSNWQIVGAQVVNAAGSVDGTAINLNAAVDHDGPPATSGDSDVDNNGSLDTQVFGDDPGEIVLNTNPLKITNIGFLAGTSNDQNATLDFTLTVTDNDGDSVAQDYTVNIGDFPGDTTEPLSLPLSTMMVSSEPANDTSSFSSLLASDSQLQKTAANSNTTMMAAAVAAAGFSVTQAAAADHGQAGMREAGIDTSNFASKLGSFAIDSGDEGRSMLSNEVKVAANDEAQTLSSGHGNSAHAESAQGLDTAAAHLHAAVIEMFAGGDHGPMSEAAASVSAPAVAMVSAEALQAGLAGNAQHGGAVEKVLAEALGHGGPPTVDGLLQAIVGHGNAELPAMAHVTSPAADGVPAWDMGSHGAFVPGADMMFKMGAEMLHHDAVQPVVNG